MDKQSLIECLKVLQKSGDTEVAHAEADGLLLEYIDDEEIEEEYHKVDKWYA